jgi:hypothetical protein
MEDVSRHTQIAGLYLRHGRRVKAHANCRLAPTPRKSCQGTCKTVKVEEAWQQKTDFGSLWRSKPKKTEGKRTATENGQRNWSKDINSKESMVGNQYRPAKRGHTGSAHPHPSTTPTLPHASTLFPPPLLPSCTGALARSNPSVAGDHDYSAVRPEGHGGSAVFSEAQQKLIRWQSTILGEDGNIVMESIQENAVMAGRLPADVTKVVEKCCQDLDRRVARLEKRTKWKEKGSQRD